MVSEAVHKKAAQTAGDERAEQGEQRRAAFKTDSG